MLDRQMFIEALQIIVNCLPTAHVNERVDGLYHFFKKEDVKALVATAEAIAKEEERFPTPVIFERYLKRFRTKKDATDISVCDFCGSVGMVTARDAEGASFAFRCHCPNAAGFQKIPAWTTDKRAHYQLIESNPFQDLYDNPEIYRKGLNYMKAQGINMPKAMREALEKRLAVAEQAKARREEPPPF